MKSGFAKVKPVKVQGGWRADFTVFQEGPDPVGSEDGYQGEVSATREFATRLASKHPG
jgi:hypothetical protein